ncbi:hypothetical protein D3C75_1298080 [compost metagenome]
MVKDEADKGTPAWDLIMAIIDASLNGLVEDSELIGLTGLIRSRMEKNKEE